MKGETENRVKALLTEGFTDKEIADKLCISVRCVKSHVQRLKKERGLYGPGNSRKLIVLLVREMFALTDGAAHPTLPASTPEKKQHADDAAQL